METAFRNRLAPTPKNLCEYARAGVRLWRVKGSKSADWACAARAFKLTTVDTHSPGFS